MTNFCLFTLGQHTYGSYVHLGIFGGEEREEILEMVSGVVKGGMEGLPPLSLSQQ